MQRLFQKKLTTVSISVWRSSLLALALTLGHMGAANGVPVTVPATTSLNADGTTYGPSVGDLSADSDRSSEDSERVTSNNASLGDRIAGIGKVHVSGNVSSTNPIEYDTVGSDAQAFFAFSVNPRSGTIPAPPGSVLAFLQARGFPVTVAASGEVSVSFNNNGYGRASAAAGIMYANSGATLLVFTAQFGTNDAFDEVKTVWLADGLYEAFVTVSGWASASLDQTHDPATAGWASYDATADPTIRLDQAAFDAEYGPNAFLLSDYYTMDFSPNIPIPEPSTFCLLGTGCLGLLGRLRRRPVTA
jgi:hypothetical protein